MQQIQPQTPYQRFALLLLVVVLIASGAFLILSLMSNMPTSAVQAAPAALSTPEDMDIIVLCGYMPGAPCYGFTVGNDKHTITDERSKEFYCLKLPTTLADMEQCSYHTGG